MKTNPIVRQIVARRPVWISYRTVLRYFISRLKGGEAQWKQMTRSQRHTWMKQVFSEHKANREEYNFVMRGLR